MSVCSVPILLSGRLHLTRAKLNLRPLGVGGTAYEIGQCCPVGASPTGSKLSQQIRSKARVHSRKGVCGAGQRKHTGRVIEPRKQVIVDRKDTSRMSKADVVL